jgi:hypothetical protein
VTVATGLGQGRLRWPSRPTGVPGIGPPVLAHLRQRHLAEDVVQSEVEDVLLGRDVPVDGGRAHAEVLGTATSAIGMSAAVFGLTEVATRGWTDLVVQGSLVLGVIGLVTFGVAQLRVGSPLLPPHVVLDRTRGGAFLAIGLPHWRCSGSPSC